MWSCLRDTRRLYLLKKPSSPGTQQPGLFAGPPTTLATMYPYGLHELRFFTAQAPTEEKADALREFLSDFKGRGCRFAFTPPAPGQPAHALRVLAYASTGKVLAELRALLPDEPLLNVEQAAALVGVWRAASVREV